MIKNYFTIAWRNLLRNKATSFINIGGLSIGMAVAMLIGFWIWDEVSYDHYHANHKELAQVMTNFYDDNNQPKTGTAVAMPLAEELRSKYGNDFTNVAKTSWNLKHILAVGDKKITSSGMWVESNFPTMFSLKMLEGNIEALNDPSSVLLNASLARSLFGDVNSALNKTVKFENKDSYKVAGVFEDLPRNTTLYESTLFLPWKKYITTEQWLKDVTADWNNHGWQTFVQVDRNIDIDKITEKIKGASMAHKVAADGRESLVLQPMDKWRLYSEFENGIAVSGRIQFVWLFAFIGFFVLMLACINFMNLSTARSEKRAKEVGIRKTIGSLRTQLVGQFLSESVLVSCISFVFSILLVILLIPVFTKLADKDIQFPWINVFFWLSALVFTLITGLIAGSYPAFYLSKFEPIKVLKGSFRTGRYASLPRKVLVVLQFTFSIALVIGTVIVYNQIQYAKNRAVSYSREGLITVPVSTPDLYNHLDALRSDLLASGAVENMAPSSSPTTGVHSNDNRYNWEGKEPGTLPLFGTIAVTQDFGKTIGWQITEGRDFAKEFADSSGLILNESAAKIVGSKNIIGKIIQFKGKNYSVTGVVKDMVMESPYMPIRPTIFLYDPYWISLVTVRLKAGIPVQEALSKTEAIFRKYDPGSPFDYSFNDEEYARKFSDERRIGNLATFFTILAIFISCLGLFGLASFVAEQRKKEIGVRKVLGASVFNLWQMLSREFALLVIISCFIAIPVASYYLSDWLKQYEYRTPISSWIFVLSGLGALVVTLLTVSFQAIKAALANPVKSLRSE